MASLLAALVVLTALALASARTYIECECSPSKRGYRSGARADLLAARRKIAEMAKRLEGEMKSDPSISRVTIERSLRKKAIVHWDSCIGNFNQEECVNADAFLRTGDCYPNCDSFCRYNPVSWVNLADGRAKPACDAVNGFKSTEQTIVDKNPDFRSAVRPSPSPVKPSPTPSSSRRPRTAKTTAAAAASKAAAAPSPSPSPSMTVTGPTAVPIATRDPSRTSAGATSRKPDPTKTPVPGTSDAADAAGAVEPSPAPSVQAQNEIFRNQPPVTRNEGCVAVEHLAGYVLQHPTHLRRAVLCARGFCATPNHAILVDGHLTSMKVLCASRWKCARSVKLVNNLKLAYNRRARVSDSITVTPYDLRFPKAAVWVVQIAEDVLNLVGVSVAAAGVAVIALAAASRISV